MMERRRFGFCAYNTLFRRRTLAFHTLYRPRLLKQRKPPNRWFYSKIKASLFPLLIVYNFDIMNL